VRRPPPARGHRPGERGAAAAELAVVAPLLLLLLAAVVFVGRLARAEGQVEGAARDAARAAAARRTPTAAGVAAQAEAEAALRAAGITCSPLAVALDTGRFRPGGAVGVQVTCTVSLRDLELLGLPGATTRRATVEAPIDRFRGTG
jgi:Flp pilus assembly protein TadG